MRKDMQELLNQEQILVSAKGKKLLERLSEELTEQERAQMILFGQVNIWHGALPMADCMDAAVCLSDWGLRIYAKVWKTEYWFQLAWEEMDQLDVKAGRFSGLELNTRNEADRICFRENFHGKVTTERVNKIEQIKRQYYYKDEE